MNKLILGSLVLLLLFSTGTAFAEYRMKCRHELSGQEEVVTVKEADTFEEAVQQVKLDPQYGHYNYRMCRDDGGDKIHTFRYPTIKGHRLDWCRLWARDCGKGAANSFCRSKGYSRAKSWEIDSDIGQHSPTYVIETGQICKQSFCDGFKYIVCE